MSDLKRTFSQIEEVDSQIEKDSQYIKKAINRNTQTQIEINEQYEIDVTAAIRRVKIIYDAMRYQIALHNRMQLDIKYIDAKRENS